MSLTFRLEQKNDYRTVEEMTREAFWNLYVPGADEHFLAHTLRKSRGFIKELDFVAISDGSIVGNIIYSKAIVKDAAGNGHEIITFGPVSVWPKLHNQGIGAALIRHSIKTAADMGYRAIAIYGYPGYYQRFGFECSKKFGICAGDGRYLKALQVLELYEGALKDISGTLILDEAFEVDAAACEEFEKTFPPKEKMETESQKMFATMVDNLAD